MHSISFKLSGVQYILCLRTFSTFTLEMCYPVLTVHILTGIFGKHSNCQNSKLPFIVFPIKGRTCSHAFVCIHMYVQISGTSRCFYFENGQRRCVFLLLNFMLLLAVKNISLDRRFATWRCEFLLSFRHLQVLFHI